MAASRVESLRDAEAAALAAYESARVARVEAEGREPLPGWVRFLLPRLTDPRPSRIGPSIPECDGQGYSEPIMAQADRLRVVLFRPTRAGRREVLQALLALEDARDHGEIEDEVTP